jgi:hypothetical protein
MSDEKNMPQGEEQEEILNEEELDEVVGGLGGTTGPRNPFPSGAMSTGEADESLWKLETPRYLRRA